MKLLFTPATAPDSSLLLEMMHEFYEGERMVFDESIAFPSLQQLFHDPALGRVYRIDMDSIPIGYCILTFAFSIEFHGRFALLDEFFVREGNRGKGIGRESLAFLQKVCREEGIKAIRLEVVHRNMRAFSLYQSLGFVLHDRYLMTKWL